MRSKLASCLALTIITFSLLSGCSSLSINPAKDDSRYNVTIHKDAKVNLHNITAEENETSIIISGNASLKTPAPLSRFSVGDFVLVSFYDANGILLYSEKGYLWPKMSWGKVSRPSYLGKRFQVVVSKKKLHPQNNIHIELSYVEDYR